MFISVIIATYNPDLLRLRKTLDGLKEQIFSLESWELIIIDNASTNNVLNAIDLSWHPQGKIVKEPNMGLTYARLKGFEESRGEVIVMVDDDNILNENYLKNAIDFLGTYPQVGAVGGKSLGEFEGFTPEPWMEQFYSMIAVRDLGDQMIISDKELTDYPSCAPIGAGMAIRKKLLDYYVKDIAQSATIISDRKGNSLSSGGDNEINISVLKQGFAVAYTPHLVLKHIIPPQRLSVDYLAKLNHDSSKSWIQLLIKYGISPWKNIFPLTLGFRKAKAWFTYRAWKKPVNYIKWRGACGLFEGLAVKT